MKKDFKHLGGLISRNLQLYFKDKFTFWMSLLTPLILIVLFLTFLGSVYENSLLMMLPEGTEVSSKLVNAFTGGWLFSSILGASCVTVAFCSNMMITDKINKSILDLQITPAKNWIISTSYFLSNFIATFIVCFVALVVGLIYLGIVGWFITFLDIILILINMVLCIMFGTLLASILSLFVSTQGGLSAMATMVSSMYGFVCGAYMPISQFAPAIKAFVSFIPGTYGTVLFRNGFMGGTLKELSKTLSPEVINGVKDGFDGNFYFFGNKVETWAMYLILISTVVVLFGLYVLFVNLQQKKYKLINEKSKEKKTV